LATIETPFLSGDAYNMAGNQQEAKNNYLTILRSGGIPEFKSIICYNILLAVYCIPLTSPQPSIKKVSDDDALKANLKKIEIALLLCRLCKIYVVFAIVCSEILSLFRVTNARANDKIYLRDIDRR